MFYRKSCKLLYDTVRLIELDLFITFVLHIFTANGILNSNHSKNYIGSRKCLFLSDRKVHYQGKPLMAFSDCFLTRIYTTHIARVVHMRFGSASFYPKEVTHIYHANLKFWGCKLFSVPSVKLTANSFSVTITKFWLLIFALHPAIHDKMVYYERQCHRICTLQWTYSSHIWIRLRWKIEISHICMNKTLHSERDVHIANFPQEAKYILQTDTHIPITTWDGCEMSKFRWLIFRHWSLIYNMIGSKYPILPSYVLSMLDYVPKYSYRTRY